MQENYYEYVTVKLHTILDNAQLAGALRGWDFGASIPCRQPVRCTSTSLMLNHANTQKTYVAATAWM